MTATISLCGETIPVSPQRHARVVHYLGAEIGLLIENLQELDGKNLVQVLDERVYDVLAKLVHGFEQAVPRYRFEGYVSQEAFESGDYDPEADEFSATVPEIRQAMQTLAEVNDLGAIAPKVLMEAFRRLAEEEPEAVEDSLSTTSASSPSATAGSAPSTSSGTNGSTDPIKLTKDSPWPVYTGSSTPTSAGASAN